MTHTKAKSAPVRRYQMTRGTDQALVFDEGKGTGCGSGLLEAVQVLYFVLLIHACRNFAVVSSRTNSNCNVHKLCFSMSTMKAVDVSSHVSWSPDGNEEDKKKEGWEKEEKRRIQGGETERQSPQCLCSVVILCDPL